MKFRPFGLHRTVLRAGGHALPRRRLRQHPRAAAAAAHHATSNLSLAAAGTLQMCFQLANSVAQLGFGHIADRWRPRVLLLAGPLLCVSDAAADRPRADRLDARGRADRRRARRRGVPPAGRGAGAPVRRRRQRGLAMSFHITSGTLGQAMAPLRVRAVRAAASDCARRRC